MTAASVSSLPTHGLTAASRRLSTANTLSSRSGGATRPGSCHGWTGARGAQTVGMPSGETRSEGIARARESAAMRTFAAHPKRESGADAQFSIVESTGWGITSSTRMPSPWWLSETEL